MTHFFKYILVPVCLVNIIGGGVAWALRRWKPKLSRVVIGTTGGFAAALALSAIYILWAINSARALGDQTVGGAVALIILSGLMLSWIIVWPFSSLLLSFIIPGPVAADPALTAPPQMPPATPAGSPIAVGLAVRVARWALVIGAALPIVCLAVVTWGVLSGHWKSPGVDGPLWVPVVSCILGLLPSIMLWVLAYVLQRDGFARWSLCVLLLIIIPALGVLSNILRGKALPSPTRSLSAGLAGQSPAGAYQASPHILQEPADVNPRDTILRASGSSSAEDVRPTGAAIGRVRTNAAPLVGTVADSRTPDIG